MADPAKNPEMGAEARHSIGLTQFSGAIKKRKKHRPFTQSSPNPSNPSKGPKNASDFSIGIWFTSGWSTSTVASPACSARSGCLRRSPRWARPPTFARHSRGWESTRHFAGSVTSRHGRWTYSGVGGFPVFHDLRAGTDECGRCPVFT